MRRVNRMLNGSQDDWVQRLVKMRDLTVAAIGRKHILRQIIGANTEKVGVLRQLISHFHGGRDLNHHADLNLTRTADSFRLQLLTFFF